MLWMPYQIYTHFHSLSAMLQIWTWEAYKLEAIVNLWKFSIILSVYIFKLWWILKMIPLHSIHLTKESNFVWVASVHVDIMERVLTNLSKNKCFYLINEHNNSFIRNTKNLWILNKLKLLLIYRTPNATKIRL